MFGGGGRPGAPGAPGLPFGGIPHELQDGVDELLAEEPDHGEPKVVFSQQQSLKEQKRLSLWELLIEYPQMLVYADGADHRDERGAPSRPQADRARHQRRHAAGHITTCGLVVLIAGDLSRVRRVVLDQPKGRRCRVTGRLAAWVMNDLRVKVFSHLQRLSLDFFTDEKAGVIMTRMTSDIENLQQLLQDGLAQFAMQGLTMVIITIILFTINVELAWITVLLVVPILVAMSLWFRVTSERGYRPGPRRDRPAC